MFLFFTPRLKNQLSSKGGPKKKKKKRSRRTRDGKLKKNLKWLCFIVCD